MPRIFVIPTDAVNACAAGVLPGSQCIGVTKGALRMFDDDELSAVLAHEVSHLRHRDTLFYGWWIALTGVVIWFGAVAVGVGLAMMASSRQSYRKKKESAGGLFGLIFILWGAVFALLAILVIQLVLHWLMRHSEYEADAGAVHLTGSTRPMIQALRKMDATSAFMNQPSSLSMLFSSNPTRRDTWWTALFSTHPPMARRIARLERMEETFA